MTLSTAADDQTQRGVVTYGFRPSLMGAPRNFALHPDAMHWEIGRHSGRLPYRSIRRIRLSYRPMTMQMHRFEMEIWSDAAPKLVIASSSSRSMVEQERQDPGYRAFVHGLHRHLRECGAEPILRAGTASVLYWPGIVLFAMMLVAMPVMLLRLPRGDALWGAALVVAVTALFLWQLGKFFWLNRPATYTVDSVPEAVLP